MLSSLGQSKTFRLTAKIACRVLLGLTLLLTLVAIVLTAGILNRAPFHQVVSVWLNVSIAFYVVFGVLVLASLVYYPRGSVIENATPTSSDLLPGSDTGSKTEQAGKSRFKCSKGEVFLAVVSFFVTSVCLLILTSFMFPEAYRSTTGLRVQRLGSASPDTIRLMLRDPSKTEHKLYYRLAESNADFTEVAFNVDPELDHTSFITVSGLIPSTTYTYRFDDGPLNNFTTSPPANSQNAFSFYFGSCFLYNFPTFRQAPGWGHVDTLLSTAPRDPKKSFLAFLGDFIYSDHPWYRGSEFSNYATNYRQTFTNKYIQDTQSKYPGFYIFDDHEIYDNWDQGKTPTFMNAMKAWNAFVGKGNPTVDDENEYFDTDYGDVAMFFLDTRTHRSANDVPDGSEKTLLGAGQKQRLFNWLLAKNATATFKFIFSPTGWTALLNKNDDGWRGYLTERNSILNFIRQNNIIGCAFFSADSHFAYGRVALQEPDTGLFEFSASPLSAFSSATTSLTPKAKFGTDTNETVAWHSLGSGVTVSLLGLVDVDTTAPVPYFNVSFYEGTTLLHVEHVNITQTIPKPL